MKGRDEEHTGLIEIHLFDLCNHWSINKHQLFIQLKDLHCPSIHRHGEAV